MKEIAISIRFRSPDETKKMAQERHRKLRILAGNAKCSRAEYLRRFIDRQWEKENTTS